MKTPSLADRVMNSQSFISSYKQRRPWKDRIDPAILQSIFSWRHLNYLLATHRITNDRLRLSRADDFSTPNKLAFRPAYDQFGRPTDWLAIYELHRLMELGVTGVLEATNELIPEIGTFTAALQAKFCAQSCANAYFSFGSTSGFGPHYDDHDVIVIQFNGRKHWHFRRSETSSQRATVDDLGTIVADDLNEAMLLQEGDIMFVPKGTWHDVVALAEPSLHITISIVYPTISNFLNWVLQQHQYGLPFQDIRKDDADEVNSIATRSSAFLCKAISQDALHRFLNAYYEKHAANRTTPSFPTLNSAGASDSYVLIPYRFTILGPAENMSSGHKISALGREYNISNAEYQILNVLSYKRPSSLADILASVANCVPGPDGVTTAIKRLLDCGLISKASATAETEH